MARPKKKFDKAIFEGLCEIQCTKDEICAVLRCDEKTLTRWCQDTYGEGFSDVFKKHSGTGKSSLRRMQWDAVRKGNTSMLIWLGKQYLGQRDTPKDVDDTKEKLDKLVQAIEANIQPEADSSPPGSES